MKIVISDGGEEKLTLDDFSKVADEIDIRTNKRGGFKDVSSKPIYLEIYSPDYPNNLQFIDLPGFIKGSCSKLNFF